MNVPKLIVAIGLLAASTATASADCTDGIGLSASAVSNPAITYDPLSGMPETMSASVTITNTGAGAACNVRVTWTRTGASWNPVNGADTLTVTGLQSAFNGSMSSESLAQTGIARTGDIPEGQSRTYVLTATLAPGQYVPPLTYARGIAMTFETRDPTGAPAYAPIGGVQSGDFSANVTKAVDFNFAGTNTTFGGGDAAQSYEVDFGEMTSNGVRNIFIQFRGNTSVLTTFASENLGTLKNGNNAVPYTIAIDGAALPLSQGPQSPPAMSANTGTGGVQTYPIAITLGDVAAKPAGTYSDTITVTIEPQ